MWFESTQSFWPTYYISREICLNRTFEESYGLRRDLNLKREMASFLFPWFDWLFCFLYYGKRRELNLLWGHIHLIFIRNKSTETYNLKNKKECIPHGVTRLSNSIKKKEQRWPLELLADHKSVKYPKGRKGLLNWNYACTAFVWIYSKVWSSLHSCNFSFLNPITNFWFQKTSLWRTEIQFLLWTYSYARQISIKRQKVYRTEFCNGLYCSFQPPSVEGAKGLF